MNAACLLIVANHSQHPTTRFLRENGVPHLRMRHKDIKMFVAVYLCERSNRFHNMGSARSFLEVRGRDGDDADASSESSDSSVGLQV